MKSPLQTLRAPAAALGLLACAAGCKHTVAFEPIEVKPIHMTLDINLKVDRELDEFFEEVEPPPAPAATTAPATMPAVDETGAPAATPMFSGLQGGPS